jgi:DMSO/TMAO reductase YedYZ heme-binding membrane subunit
VNLPLTLPSGPILWFANRGTGIVLLVLYTVVVVLGILSSSSRGPGRFVPAFVTQGMHRNLALLSMLLLGAHITTAVLDDYVDIRWFDALLPVGGLYRPIYLGLGALSLDLLIAIALTTALRRRIPERVWRRIHLLSYASWVAAVVHTIGIGTDVGTPWARWTLLGCVAAVVAAAVGRSTSRRLAVLRS